MLFNCNTNYAKLKSPLDNMWDVRFGSNSWKGCVCVCVCVDNNVSLMECNAVELVRRTLLTLSLSLFILVLSFSFFLFPFHHFPMLTELFHSFDLNLTHSYMPVYVCFFLSLSLSLPPSLPHSLSLSLSLFLLPLSALCYHGV